MAIDTAFGDLSLKMDRLRDVLLGLRLAVVEDKPLQGAGALLDRLGEAVLDLEEWLGESLEAAALGQRAAQYPRDLEASRDALATCQERFQRFQRQLSSEVTSFERIGDLASLAHGRGREWTSWVASVRGSIDQCQGATHDVSEALFQCWQEIAERAGAPASNKTPSLERTRSHGIQ
ncbi:MAG TPA: hypothetical protein VKK31_21985 [Thermoanaerobaculia bacterium]|nr:hypothetical protein [Thermoanaerobaculia bacterium]